MVHPLSDINNNVWHYFEGALLFSFSAIYLPEIHVAPLPMYCTNAGSLQQVADR